MDLAKYKETYTEEDAPGWLAIDEAVKKLYPEQEPKHWAATPHYMIGGKDPIDGISIYEAQFNGEKYHHFVTYGFSNLYYNEEHAGNEYSKFGFELTFRLKHYYLDKNGPNWVFNFLQNIARYVFNSGKWFEPNHHMSANGPIRLDSDTKITAIVFTLDPELKKIETPHGEVQFLQILGVTEDEYRSIKGSTEATIKLLDKHLTNNPLLITNLDSRWTSKLLKQIKNFF